MAAATPKRHRSFTRDHLQKREPITFDIYDETFEAWPSLQGVVLLEFVAELNKFNGPQDGEDSETAADTGAAAAAVLLSFFDHALKPESLERFKALTHDPERVVEIDDLNEIVSWLMEEYTSRPTEAS